jgi:hypothetical protein
MMIQTILKDADAGYEPTTIYRVVANLWQVAKKYIFLAVFLKYQVLS